MRLNSQSKVNIFLMSDNKEIKIIINDDGPGFPKDIIAKLGEPYIKSKSKELRSNSGLGLGTFRQNIIRKTKCKTFI